MTALSTAPCSAGLGPPRALGGSRHRLSAGTALRCLSGEARDDIVRRYGQAPERLLVDTHYATAEDIVSLAAHAAGPVAVYAPTATEREDITPASLRNRKSKRAREPQSLKDWRSRMADAAGQAVYRLRKLIERVNADRKNHGFGFLPVRGLIRAQAVALLHALAHNLVTAVRLRLRGESA